MDRIAAFKSIIARSPADPFPRYGLAMEHKSRGDHAEAWTAFEERFLAGDEAAYQAAVADFHAAEPGVAP